MLVAKRCVGGALVEVLEVDVRGVGVGVTWIFGHAFNTIGRHYVARDVFRASSGGMIFV